MSEIKLRAALEDAAAYLRLGMTWIVDGDRHDKMKRAWERAREALETHKSDDENRGSLWLVWFAYYSQQANVGIVGADSAEVACREFWEQYGDARTWPSSGVHALPVVPGGVVEIRAEH